MELHLIPCGAPSSASCLVIAMTPPLDAACAVAPMYSRARMPDSEALLMIEPPCRARWRHAARIGMNTMSSSPLSVSVHSFGVISSTGAKCTEAALL